MTSTTAPQPVTGPSPAPAARGRRVVLGAVAVLVLVTVAGVVLLTRGGSDEAPYTDARSTGRLTLCGADGKPVTSGSTTRAPFVARAVGSTGVTGQAAATGRTATLYAFQPRQGTDAQEWSGQQLTAAATYTNPRHPMAEATSKDIALRDFLTAFPARWDGYLQLRLYLASPVTGAGAQYDSASIKVTGDRWKLVGTAGTASCTGGDATSSETRTASTS